MAGRNSNSNTQLLDELEALSQSMYQTHTSSTTNNRRTASFAVPRTSAASISSLDEIKPVKIEERTSSRPRARRMSLSPWRSRPKLVEEDEHKEVEKVVSQTKFNVNDEKEDNSAEKKGIWKWKPIRALSHIGMQKLSCLFSIEVVTVQGLQASMNGLRLSVCVRKKETKDGAVHTMPSRVSHGAADFEETLFLKCHVYCSPGNGNQMKFEPRPFWIYVFAVDAQDLDFGRSSVELTNLIQESIEKSFDNNRVRQWDMSFNLSGKAKGGELVLKLGFQMMGKDLYNQAEATKSNQPKNLTSSIGRKQSKSSFSIPSPKISSRSEAWTPSQKKIAADFQVMDDLNLDDPDPIPISEGKSEQAEPKVEDIDIIDFDVVDKGIEVEENEDVDDDVSEVNTEGKSTSSEVVKEVVHDQLHLMRLNELDSIAQQIKALESMMEEEKTAKMENETGSQKLDEDEETVTKEFLQLLEDDDDEGFGFKLNKPELPRLELDGAEDSKVYLPDLGKGLGCVIQTKDGGLLAAMNPQDTLVEKKDTAKLAMQMSKPLVITPSHDSTNGFELFQKLAAVGLDEFSSRVLSLMPMEELTGKTAEQIAFEGIASAIIQGRNKEGASSSAARAVYAVKNMAIALSSGRQQRISTGIWNVNENPLRAEEILAFSLQKIEAMAVEALKVEADMSEEEAPFEVSPLNEKGSHKLLDSAVPLEDWIKKETREPITIFLAVVVQLRDPLRRYEAVGGPVMALIQATQTDTNADKYNTEKRFKVTSAHVGGLKVRTGGKKNAWDSERQRLTAMQWLVEYGLGKAGKKGKNLLPKGQDMLWSLSSRVMADMWLKSMRNPDVRFGN